MTRLVWAEALKLRTTRSFWVISLGALGLVLVAVIALSAASTFAPGDHPAREMLALAGPAQTFALLLGVLAVAGEFRHRTIISALLLTPRRTPLLVAKLLALAAAGLILGLLAFAGAAALTLGILTGRHIPSQLDTASTAWIVAGGAIAAALAAALGAALGAVIRNQVGAVMTVLCTLYVIEPLASVAPGIGPGVQRYGLAGLSSGASGTTGFPTSGHLLAQAPAALVLAGYTAAVVFAGVVVFRRRDLAV